MNGLQLSLTQLDLPGGILREQAALLCAQALTIGFILPGTGNIEFHVFVSFPGSTCKSGHLWQPPAYSKFPDAFKGTDASLKARVLLLHPDLPFLTSRIPLSRSALLLSQLV
jgi:hypothetical protein